MKTVLINFFKGMLIGVSNIIPGVSGGTIAVVLGIFDMLIEAINNFYKGIDNFKRYFIFLLPIVLGAGFSIAALSSLIAFSLENYTFPTVLFFIGLVVGSVPVICKKAFEKGFNFLYLAISVVAFFVVAVTAYINVSETASASSDNSFFLMLQMFFSGMVAAAAMVIPGISGSFIMVLMGMYEMVIQTISAFVAALLSLDLDALLHNAALILPMGIGIILGIVLVSKIISYLLENFYSVTYYAILGLVIGSIFGLAFDLFASSEITGFTLVISGAISFCIGVMLSLKLADE